MEIHTRSTSRNSAECDPIVLRETDRVRLVFLPMLINNEGAPNDCVRGTFVYQRKLKASEWAAVATIPLNQLKSNEGYKLELHASELAALGQGLKPLYALHRQRGIPQGKATFLKLEAGLARFMELNEQDLREFLELHPQQAATTLGRLLRWMTTSPQGATTAERLASLGTDELPALASLLGLANVRGALEHWRANRQNTSEEFWQQTLSERAYVLSQVFAYPVVVIGEKAYVGGKGLDNKGGNLVDFFGAVESTDAVALIEIKTPSTKLLGGQYRATFPLSHDLMGAIAQTMQYRQSLMRSFDSVSANHPRRLTLGEPRCLVVAGNAESELRSPGMREAFELQRERLSGVTVVTYDELFLRLKRFLALLEGNLTSGPPQQPVASTAR